MSDTNAHIEDAYNDWQPSSAHHVFLADLFEATSRAANGEGDAEEGRAAWEMHRTDGVVDMQEALDATETVLEEEMA